MTVHYNLSCKDPSFGLGKKTNNEYKYGIIYLLSPITGIAVGLISKSLRHD